MRKLTGQKKFPILSEMFIKFKMECLFLEYVVILAYTLFADKGYLDPTIHFDQEL